MPASMRRSAAPATIRYELKDEPLVCPVCGDKQLHLAPVSVTPAAETITVGYSHGGPSLEHSFDLPVRARGAKVRLTFLGECGHASGLAVWFHKGTTYATWEILGDNMADQSDFQSREFDFLWRD
jgi:hypothetical protein